MPTMTRQDNNREAQRRIAEAKRRNLPGLDLSDLNLSELPPEIASLTTLHTLVLGNNQLTTLPPAIAPLAALRELRLGNNQLTTLPPDIASLTALEQLDLSNNQFTTLPPAIASLTALEQLYLSNNQLTTLPPSIASLLALRALNLSNNQLTTLPPEIASLTVLEQLDLSNNQFTTLPPAIASLTALWKLDLSNNQLTTLPPAITSLTALQYLYLSDNQLTTLPPAVTSLTAVHYLYLSDNQLTTLPPAIASLKSLHAFGLSNNQLTTLPPEIASLTGLSNLYLDGNQLASLPPALRQLKWLRSLTLHRNPRLRLSPTILGPDRNKRGFDPEKLPSAASILDFYFGRLAGSTRPLNEVKLILVGRGGAGKTSIVRALRGLPFHHSEASTPGIALSDWVLKGCKGGNVTAHVWDFAGQVITHALHQFFFSVRTVYILALTGRENSEREDAEYWLRLIKAFGTGDDGESPDVVIALNKWDTTGCRPRIDRSALQERYPFIRGFVEVDCKTNRGITKLEEMLKRQVALMKWVRDPFKESWDEVRRALTKGSQIAPYLTYDEFRKLCDRHEITDRTEQDSLAEVLHNLGSALNYRNDPRLREATVLKPQWLTKNVYALVRKAENQAGILSRPDVDAARVKVVDPKMKDYLVRLMERYEFAYPSRTTSAATWVVPQALPDVQPKGAEEFAAKTDATRLRYEYQALPAGLVPRAIVRLHEFIETVKGTKLQWASGAIVAREGARALIRTEPQDRQVMITVTGPPDARRQLAGLCQAEMRDIHREIQGLNPREETQVNGSWVPTAVLEADERSGQRTGVATPDKGTVSIDPAGPNNAYSMKDARAPDIWKPTAFICYSKANSNERKRLESELIVLENEGLLAGHWHDRMIDPGDEWDPEIQRSLAEAHIIIILLSSASLSTKYIRLKEIPRSIELHKSGKATVIPLVLEKCRWVETPLGELLALPDIGKPLNKWNPRADGWSLVADGLAKVCKNLMSERRKT
jgi:internalin A